MNSKRTLFFKVVMLMLIFSLFSWLMFIELSLVEKKFSLFMANFDYFVVIHLFMRGWSRDITVSRFVFWM